MSKSRAEDMVIRQTRVRNIILSQSQKLPLLEIVFLGTGFILLIIFLIAVLASSILGDFTPAPAEKEAIDGWLNSTITPAPGG